MAVSTIKNWNIAGGREVVGSINANSYKDITVTHNFPAGTYRLVATLYSSGTASNIGSICVAVESTGANTATIRIFNDRNNAINPGLEWIAIRTS